MSTTPKSYRRRRYSAAVLAKTPAPPQVWIDSDPVEKLAAEVGFDSRRDSICICCEHLIREGNPIYWVPQTGLARHAQCDPTPAYMSALAEWMVVVNAAKAVKAKAAARDKAQRTVNEALALLSQPQNSDARRSAIAMLAAVDQQHCQHQHEQAHERKRTHLKLVKG